jgi:DNA-binding NtrC family response regulator
LPFDWSKSYNDNKKEAVATFEREYVTQLLNRSGGNLVQAANAGRCDRKRLGELVKKHKLQAVRLAVMDKPPITQRSDI